jgi:hypothetical protein
MANTYTARMIISSSARSVANAGLPRPSKRESGNIWEEWHDGYGAFTHKFRIFRHRRRVEI